MIYAIGMRSRSAPGAARPASRAAASVRARPCRAAATAAAVRTRPGPASARLRIGRRLLRAHGHGRPRDDVRDGGRRTAPPVPHRLRGARGRRQDAPDHGPRARARHHGSSEAVVPRAEEGGPMNPRPAPSHDPRAGDGRRHPACDRGPGRRSSSTPPPPASPTPQQQPPPVFRAGVETVAIYATVLDRYGEMVLNLTRDDFAVYDNGVRQELSTVRRRACSRSPPSSSSTPARA